MRETDERTRAMDRLDEELPADPPALRDETAMALADDESESLLGILNGVTRQGAWEPAAHLNVVAFWGAVKLDFRDAALLEGPTELEIFALMGGVEIIAPSDVNIRCSGLAIAGGFPHVAHTAREADAPTIEIRGLAIMGGVDVKIV